jgi:thiol-disulfide isomerase/thioredoxin
VQAASQPNVRLVDVEGIQQAIRDNRGRVVLVDFWATWCGPCMEQFPHLSEWQDRFGREQLAVVAVSLDDPGDLKSKVQPFLRKQETEGFDLLLYETGDHDAMVNAIDPQWPGQIPALFLYDRRGQRQVSMPDEHEPADVEAAIRKLLGESAP